ncbi:MAG: AAC(3) family N-acetyltransferase [Alphaproteobacteria bacterium]
MNLLTRMKRAVRPVVLALPDRLQRRKRLRDLAASRKALSPDGLAADLDRLPIREGAVVLVHSSLKALGYVEGGAGAVVEALIGIVVERRGGTLLLPTFSIDGSMHRTLTSGRRFDQCATPSNLGAIPEAFRRHPKARRSLHPTHSLAAIGRDAARLVDGHHRCGSSFGEGSPMAELLAANGYLLGLGTDLGRVTFYHCLEEIERDFPIDVFTPDGPISVTCRSTDGALHELSIRAHDPNPAKRRIDRPENEHLRRFFQAAFEQRAGLSWHRIGEARSWLIEAKPLYAELKRLMQAGITIYSSPSDLAATSEAGSKQQEPA